MNDKIRNQTILPGDPVNSGIRHLEQGIQISFDSPDPGVELLLYEEGQDEPFRCVKLDAFPKCGDRTSLLLPSFPEPVQYVFRKGNRLLVDPYAEELCAVTTAGKTQTRGVLRKETAARTPACRIPFSELILYKTHVRGFTMKNKTCAHPGTFAGLREMIPYLQDLGINGLLLMPVYEFAVANGNYWGYTGGQYFAPKRAYCAGKDPGAEFAGLVDALHTSGIACFLEFYFSPQEDGRFVTDVVRHWAGRFHLDGVRLVGDGPWMRAARRDPLLSELALFLPYTEEDTPDPLRKKEKREAVYQSTYRDRIRRFLIGDRQIPVGDVTAAQRENGTGQSPVNFVADQDGFPLADMVAYEERHNEANGENNQDGIAENHTWNCGVEGATRRPQILRLRERQIRNAAMLLLTAQGIPLLYGGDEMDNTQKGNNNAWNRDDPTGWVDWHTGKKAMQRRAFFRDAIAFRRAHPVLHMPEPVRMADYRSFGLPDLSYHCKAAWIPVHEETRCAFGVLYCGAYATRRDGTPDDTLYLIYNMYWEEQAFALPHLPSGAVWKRKADTARESVFLRDGEEEDLPVTGQKEVIVAARSVQILIAKEED